MKLLLFASNNLHKVEEIKHIIGSLFNVQSLLEAGIDIDIPEPYDTLEENASTKSETIYKLTGQDCFGEDTGLEVEALNGEPGVKSARYAGEGRNFSDNIDKLLKKLEGQQNRRAAFRAVVSLMVNGSEHQFEGRCNGRITLLPDGEKGFGYDPIFIPDGAIITFAQMNMQEKNRYNHRQKAVLKMLEFLSTSGK